MPFNMEQLVDQKNLPLHFRLSLIQTSASQNSFGR